MTAAKLVELDIRWRGHRRVLVSIPSDIDPNEWVCDHGDDEALLDTADLIESDIDITVTGTPQTPPISHDMVVVFDHIDGCGVDYVETIDADDWDPDCATDPAPRPIPGQLDIYGQEAS